MLRFENAEECQLREETAQTKGLEKNATWDKIINFNAEQERKELVIEFGLRKKAGWRDIVRANDENISTMSPWRK